MPDLDWNVGGMLTGAVAVIGFIARILLNLKRQLDGHDKQSDRLDIVEKDVEALKKDQSHTEDRVSDLMALVSRMEGKLDTIMLWLQERAKSEGK